MKGYFNISLLATCSQSVLDGLGPTFEIINVTNVLVMSLRHSGVKSFFLIHESVSGLQCVGISKLPEERFPDVLDEILAVSDTVCS